jgi:hypothetical protein
MAMGVSDPDITDIIFIRIECSKGIVRLSMNRVFAPKSRIFDATFYKGYEATDEKNMRTYWRSDDGEHDAVFDGSPDTLFSAIGDGDFDVMVEGEGGKQRLFSFDVRDTKLTLARVKGACTSK